MAVEGAKRKLTAILSADVKGYSRLMAEDEVETAHRLKTFRRLIALRIREHRGRVVDTPGDNILAEFPSALDATRCAVDIQRTLKDRNADLPAGHRMDFRIGIHLGDVMVDGPRISGDGVNIAARLEKLSEPGGICVSAAVYEQIQGKLDFDYVNIGEKQVKNIPKPVYVYGISMDSTRAANFMRLKKIGLKRLQWMSLALIAAIAISVVWYQYLRHHSQPEVTKTQTALVHPEKPVIAVLPFDNLTGDPEREYFVDGMTEEIITRLSMNILLTVIARNSTFYYKKNPARIQQISDELGARYIVEGSVRESGKRVRITIQLIDAHTEGHLWASNYDGELADLISLQDEIAKRIVAALNVGISEAEMERIQYTKTKSLTAYDFYQRGRRHLRSETIEGNAKAREMLEKAIELDPEYAAAYTAMGYSYFWDSYLAWGRDPKALQKAFDLVQRSLTMERSLPESYRLLAHIHLMKGEHGQALIEADKAIVINPNDAAAYWVMGDALTEMRKWDDAIEQYEEAIRLNPRHPASWVTMLSRAYRWTGQYDKAISTVNRAISLNPEWQSLYPALASHYWESWWTQRNDDPRALEKALHAIETERQVVGTLPIANHYALMALAHSFRKEHKKALSLAVKTLESSPQDYVKVWIASVYANAGRLKKAIEILEESAPGSWELGPVYRLAGQTKKSLEILEHASKTNLSHNQAVFVHTQLAILYAESGRINAARAEAQEILKLVPNFSVEVWGQRFPFKDQTQTERDMAALRKAGLK